MVNQIPILHMLEAVKPVLAVVTGAALVMPKIALVMSLIYMHVAKLCGIIARVVQFTEVEIRLWMLGFLHIMLSS